MSRNSSAPPRVAPRVERPWPQARQAAAFGLPTPPAGRSTWPASANNLDKTSVPWLSWLAMLNQRPRFSHNCTGERAPAIVAGAESRDHDLAVGLQGNGRGASFAD